MRFHKSLMGALAFLALSSVGAFAQERAPRPADGGAIEKIQIETMVAPGEGDVLTVGGPNTFIFVNSEMSFERKTVKGAPYSAEATTETIQTLSDGNRIIRKNSATIYRDSEGRTRREPVTAGQGRHEGRSITISDPIAGTSMMLDPESRTAHAVKTVIAVRRADAKAEIERHRQVEVIEGGPGIRVRMPAPDADAKIYVGDPMAHGGDSKREDLGTQIIEGVAAQGTRTTTTIPAGTIGNEQPLTIVSEQWFSPDLQVLVLTRHSDPRSGETVYRLTGIVRAEPDRTLFEVPADYTVKDVGERKPVMIRRD